MEDPQKSYFQPVEDEIEHPFVMIPNELIRDPNLSPKCKWFIAYLLSHSGKWKISIPQIMRSQRISKNQMYPMINLAIDSGYLKREEYLEKGKKRYRYLVSRTPKFKKILLCPHFRDTEFEDTSLSSSYEESKDKKNKSKESAPSAEASELCQFFLSEIQKRKKNFTKTVCTSWLKYAGILLKNRGLEELKKIILQSFDDPFWFKNVLSPEKIYKHLDTLELMFSEKIPEKNEYATKSMTQQMNREWCRRIVLNNAEQAKTGEIYVGPDYIEFTSLNFTTHIKFSEKGFREQVSNRLIKMNLNIDGL